MASDEELMRAVGQGDERALGLLVERYATRIHAFLARVTGDRDDADDLLQDTWMRVARGARGFDGARLVRPWIYGIATNLARDLHRRRGVRLRAVQRGDVGAPEAAPAFQPVERIDMRERLARLPERLREALVLRYFDGLDEAEMAEALGIPRGTVKSRLHGALRALRQSWETA
jgi:RNA polymerase sigma-70 factor, ECF subfamily